MKTFLRLTGRYADSDQLISWLVFTGNAKYARRYWYYLRGAPVDVYWFVPSNLTRSYEYKVTYR